ncbi:hypothetical protein PJP40_004646 [Salmonella enterica]|nr:hypothetical protein [Salmonella enterica]
MQIKSGFTKIVIPLLFAVGIPSVQAEITERMTVNLGELTLRSRSNMERSDLSVQTLLLPPICMLDKCEDAGVLSLPDGSPVPLQSGHYVYRSGIDGLLTGFRLSDESVSSLRQGKGGSIDVTIQQGKGPYHTGEFNNDILLYGYRTPALAETEAKNIMVNIAGMVKAGSCNIIRGNQLDFRLDTTQNALTSALARDGKQFVQRESIEFDCVEVASLTMRFNSGSVKPGSRDLLFDSDTGINISLAYESNGRSGVVFWDNSPIDIPVINDKSVVNLSLYANKSTENIKVGQFSFVGTYTAEYN